MKKRKIILIVIILITLINSDSYSQRIQDPALSSNLCVKQYDIIVDGFYGVPYLAGIIYKQFIIDTLGISPNKIHNLGHFGGRFEYMVWNKIGFGIEYTYALLSFDYQGRSQIYDAGIVKQRVLAKFNFHFATSNKFDPYLTAGVGYSNTKFFYNSNTKFFNNKPGTKSEKITILPVAYRVGIGFRYFFTQMIGVNAEVGLGGPLMQAGLSFKF